MYAYRYKYQADIPPIRCSQDKAPAHTQLHAFPRIFASRGGRINPHLATLCMVSFHSLNVIKLIVNTVFHHLHHSIIHSFFKDTKCSIHFHCFLRSSYGDHKHLLHNSSASSINHLRKQTGKSLIFVFSIKLQVFFRLCIFPK